MRELRINFWPPDIVLEHAAKPYEPLRNQDLPITAALKQKLDALSEMYAAALERETQPTKREKTRFLKLYRAAMPALERELATYGIIVDENFPDLFEQEIGTHHFVARVARLWPRLAVWPFAAPGDPS